MHRIHTHLTITPLHIQNILLYFSPENRKGSEKIWNYPHMLVDSKTFEQGINSLMYKDI